MRSKNPRILMRQAKAAEKRAAKATKAATALHAKASKLGRKVKPLATKLSRMVRDVEALRTRASVFGVRAKVLREDAMKYATPKNVSATAPKAKTTRRAKRVTTTPVVAVAEKAKRTNGVPTPKVAAAVAAA